jgi:hypothetical protein
MVSLLLGNVHSTGIKGTVFVFSTLLIFKSNGRMFPIFGLKNADFVIPLKGIEKSTVRDCVVSLIVNPVIESSMSLKLPILTSLLFFWRSGPKTSPSRLEIDFILDDSPESSYFNKILNEKLEDMKGNRVNAKSHQGFKPSFLMPPSKGSIKRTNMEEDEASALGKLFAQAQIVRFKPGDTILHIGAIERRLFCVWSGVVACKSSDGKVHIYLSQCRFVCKSKYSLFSILYTLGISQTWAWRSCWRGQVSILGSCILQFDFLFLQRYCLESHTQKYCEIDIFSMP